MRSDPPFWIGLIFISATSSSGKCFLVRRTRRSVLINQMSILRWTPLTFFRERTIQASSRVWEAISTSGHKIVSSRMASAPTRQFGPTTVQPCNWAVGSTYAFFATGSAQSRVFKYVGRQSLFKIARWTPRYSLRDPMLNQFPSSSATPPILPPFWIQSIKTGINEIFCPAGMRVKIS